MTVLSPLYRLAVSSGTAGEQLEYFTPACMVIDICMLLLMTLVHSAEGIDTRISPMHMAKVMVPCKPSNRSNQQCLHLRVGRGVGLRGSVTFDPAQRARLAARCAIHLFSLVL